MSREYRFHFNTLLAQSHDTENLLVCKWRNGQGKEKDITSHQNSNFLSFQGPNCVICVLARCWAEKGPLTTKKKESKAYLTTAWTYGELLFSCAFADGPIEVTVKKKKKVTSDIPTQNKSDNYGSITLRKQQLMLLTMHLRCRIV